MFTITSILSHFVALFLGAAVMFWWYRHTLKTDPAKLDAINAQAKALRDKAVKKYDDLKDGN